MSQRAGDVTDQDVLRVLPDIRRVARSLAGDSARDVVQETVLRLLLEKQRLRRAGLRRYAEVTAHHLAVNELRDQRGGRQPDWHPADTDFSPDPHDATVRHLEHDAVLAALRQLPVTERELLLANILDERSTSRLAVEADVSAQAIALRLLRVRARLRVGTLVAYRRVTLPTERCLPVLLALSTRDQRQQRFMHAARHLGACPTCAELVPALTTRRRRLLTPLPWLVAGSLLACLRRARRPMQLAVGAGAVGAVTVAAALAVAGGGRPPQAPAPASPSAVIRGQMDTAVGTVLFGADSAVLDTRAEHVIAAAATRVQTMRATRLRVVGYTDASGGVQYDMALSAARAEAVARALRTTLGPTVAIVTLGAGSSHPFATNATAPGRAQNRRVTVTTIS